MAGREAESGPSELLIYLCFGNKKTNDQKRQGQKSLSQQKRPSQQKNASQQRTVARGAARQNTGRNESAGQTKKAALPAAHPHLHHPPGHRSRQIN